MCEYIKTTLSAHLPLHEHQRPGAVRGPGRRLVHSGHRRGDVLDRRRDAGDATSSTASVDASTSRSRTCARWPTRSAAPGRDLPFLNWRYILFIWNDSDAEMDRARAAGGGHRRRSPVLGDDGPSRRTRTLAGSCPGRPTLDVDPARDLGRQQPRQRHPRRDAARAHRRRARSCPACRSSRAPGRPLHGAHARPQSVDAPVSGQATYGRRLVRLGAQLCDADRLAHQPRFRARVAAADARTRATRSTCRSRFPRRRAAGTLPAEVRSGERRGRLVRALRIADDDEDCWSWSVTSSEVGAASLDQTSTALCETGRSVGQPSARHA